MGYSENEIITTGVDKLVDFLRGKKQIELKEAAKMLHVPTEIVQKWVDFLIEEHILGMEYKFTTPYIYLIEEENNNKTIKELKKEFQIKAKNNKLNETKSDFLWKNQIQQALTNKKSFFYKEAEKRHLTNIDYLWETYKKMVMQ
ncbi:hypothetical protein K9L97_00165 [Candidatus Woesearchaeota archaeon]|nr:hypothetical protein [Candidatus Woesearchaeota archaeon]